MQPIAVATRPADGRIDWFAIAPDPNDAHAVWWLGPPAPGAVGGVWKSLGGGGTAITATWTSDGSIMMVGLVGEDSRIWLNTFSEAQQHWTGWSPDMFEGVLHQLVVATS